MTYRISMFNIIYKLIFIIMVLCTSSVPGFILNITYLEIAMFIIIGIYDFCKISTIIDKKFVELTALVLIISFIEGIYYPLGLAKFLRVVCLFLFFLRAIAIADSRHLDCCFLFYNLFYKWNILSFSFYIFIEILGIDLPYSIFTNDFLPLYRNYFWLYFQRPGLYENLGSFYISRNCMIFTEPGLYAFFLDLMLFYVYFIKNNSKLFEIILIWICLITTFSTTGIIVALLILARYLLMKRVINGIAFILLKKITIIITTLSVICCLMLSKEVGHPFSYTTRLFDFIYGIELFLKKPFFGWGYTNTEIFKQGALAYFDLERGNSNGITGILMQLGMFGAALFIIPLYKLKKIPFFKDKHNTSVLNFFICILFMSLIGQPIQFSSTYIMIYAYIMYYTLYKNTNCKSI